MGERGWSQAREREARGVNKKKTGRGLLFRMGCARQTVDRGGPSPAPPFPATQGHLPLLPLHPFPSSPCSLRLFSYSRRPATQLLSQLHRPSLSPAVSLVSPPGGVFLYPRVPDLHHHVHVRQLLLDVPQGLGHVPGEPGDTWTGGRHGGGSGARKEGGKEGRKGRGKGGKRRRRVAAEAGGGSDDGPFAGEAQAKRRRASEASGAERPAWSQARACGSAT